MSNTASGPEYLASLADQAAANNDSPIADQLRELSRQWRGEQQQLQTAFDENSRLARQIDEARKSLAVAA